MGIFEIIEFLARFLGGLNIPGIEQKAAAWLAEKGEDYPDLKDRADALSTWLATTIAESAPNLDPTSMRNTLQGIARDVIAGTTGVDPGSWQGGA